jgi:hypothetical protein
VCGHFKYDLSDSVVGDFQLVMRITPKRKLSGGVIEGQRTDFIDEYTILQTFVPMKLCLKDCGFGAAQGWYKDKN